MKGHAPLRGGSRLNFWRLFPLIWLVYLYFPLTALLHEPHSPLVRALGLAGIAVFVLLWVRLYAGEDRPGHPRRVALTALWCLLLYVAGFAVMGYDAATFLVYAVAVLGFQANAAVAVFGTVVMLAAYLVPLQFGLAHSSFFEFAQLMVLGGAAAWGNHAAYRQFIARAQLERVQREKELLAAEAERERIARDLHDLLGHTLSVIVLKSELAGKLAERDPARAAAEIREVERISREALSEVRAAVSGYRGSGLKAELARAKVALDAAGVRLDYGGQPGPLPPAVEQGMGMVLREAVTNVVRHARASECRVSIIQGGKHDRLEIVDDGVGGEAPEGTGLTSMRERVRALGGEFTRDGSAGTRLLAQFPHTESQEQRAESESLSGPLPSALGPLPPRRPQ